MTTLQTTPLTNNRKPQSHQQSKRKIAKCDQLLDVISQKLSNAKKDDSFDLLAKVWANSLRELDTYQLPHAKKLISDVIYQAEQGTLNSESKILVSSNVPNRNLTYFPQNVFPQDSSFQFISAGAIPMQSSNSFNFTPNMASGNLDALNVSTSSTSSYNNPVNNNVCCNQSVSNVTIPSAVIPHDMH